jgi:glucuronoarabinoxylan endo-1,4-beta-xylanase
MQLKEMRRLLWLLPLVVAFGCGNDEEKEPVNPNPPVVNKKINVDPSITHQEMVGFGGALTWYSDRMISSSKKNEIAQLLFNDLGTDIVRFQAFYYPDDYPNYKGTANMNYDNSAALYNTTNQIYALMNGLDPEIKILLSSWGPPAALKSNNSERQGTLRKDGDGFVYDEFAQYWVDILDNIPFNPDYISIQNEPSYVNPGWTTCQWAGTETPTLPGYNIAFDKVNERIQTREDRPMMIGPESPNTDSFSSFADALESKDHLGMYCYHPYNLNNGSTQSQIDQALSTIKNYSDRPNIMTEFSDNLSWFNTATFINSTLTKGNSSGYIYWKMVWSTPSGTDPEAAMISINQSGNYTITPYYYLMKHFSKDINAGDKRVEVVSENTALSVSGFINEEGSQLTLVVINTGSTSSTIDLAIKDHSISTIEAVQSKVGSYYQDVDVDIDEGLLFPSQSITTITLGI